MIPRWPPRPWPWPTPEEALLRLTGVFFALSVMALVASMWLLQGDDTVRQANFSHFAEGPKPRALADDGDDEEDEN